MYRLCSILPHTFDYTWEIQFGKYSPRNIQFGIDKLLNNARVGVIMRIMKAVQIWGISGELITGGAMEKETFLDFIKNNAGVDMLEDAETLWDQATPFSLSDYLETIKVRVQEI